MTPREIAEKLLALAEKVKDDRHDPMACRNLEYALDDIDAIIALCRAVLESERDAARYRWLRAELSRVDPMIRPCAKVGFDRSASEWCDFHDDKSLDAAIDAAIEKEQS